MLSDNEIMNISNLVEEIIDKSNDAECNVNRIALSLFYYIELLERFLKELRDDSIRSKDDLKYIDVVLLPSLLERMDR